MIVEMLEKKQQHNRDFIPVFLTDSMEFDIFRSRGFAFEYLPSPGARMVNGTVPWSVYAHKRLQLLMQKWNLARVITFGSDEFGYANDTGPDGEDLLRVQEVGPKHQPALASQELPSDRDVLPAEP